MGSQKANAEALSFVHKLNTVIIFPLITLLSAVAFLVFLWGCVEYVIHADNQTARQTGVKHITWGIIGLVIMVTAWAILSLAAGTFGLQGQLDCAKDGSCDYSSLAQ
jgi:TRAP-type C4-dicarboxylate transport system permease small subunit